VSSPPCAADNREPPDRPPPLSHTTRTLPLLPRTGRCRQPVPLLHNHNHTTYHPLPFLATMRQTPLPLFLSLSLSLLITKPTECPSSISFPVRYPSHIITPQPPSQVVVAICPLLKHQRLPPLAGFGQSVVASPVPGELRTRALPSKIGPPHHRLSSTSNCRNPPEHCHPLEVARRHHPKPPPLPHHRPPSPVRPFSRNLARRNPLLILLLTVKTARRPSHCSAADRRAELERGDRAHGGGHGPARPISLLAGPAQRGHGLNLSHYYSLIFLFPKSVTL
jgi:hypothetical protein